MARSTVSARRSIISSTRVCSRTILIMDTVGSSTQMEITTLVSGLTESGRATENWLTSLVKCIKGIGNKVDLWAHERTKTIEIFKMI